MGYVVNGFSTYLVSIKPLFTEQILSGQKRYELRRKAGGISAGSLVVLYASNPVKAVVGEFWVKSIFEGSFEEVWSVVTSFENSGIDERDKPYVAGGRRVLTIEALNPKRYAKPLTLREIRKRIPSFKPPRSYVNLAEDSQLLRVLASIRST